MNPRYFGDSYDIVKRFLCFELRSCGYVVEIEPMLTGEWGGRDRHFLRLLGAELRRCAPKGRASALFFDPDTGVRQRSSKAHVSFEQIAEATKAYSLVFAFDQSFSRNANGTAAMEHKLQALAGLDCSGMYYDSHARFLFASAKRSLLRRLRKHLTALGLPSSRFHMLS